MVGSDEAELPPAAALPEPLEPQAARLIASMPAVTREISFFMVFFSFYSVFFLSLGVGILLSAPSRFVVFIISATSHAVF